jgi:uncharacterized protein
VSGSAWRSALYDYIKREAQPREKFGHQPRLYALTQQIGASETYDDDIVYAAVYLHDLGVFTGHRPEDPELLACWDNTAYAVAQSPAILRDLGFPEAKIPAVLEAIATHQPQHSPQTVEATVLRDADILEQLGAVGILRTVCKVGRDTRFHTFTDALSSLTKTLEVLPPLIRLSQARALAEPRIAALRAFLEATQAEAADNLF